MRRRRLPESSDLTRSDVGSMIASRLDDHLKSRDFKQQVQNIVADSVEELFKTLWQRTNIWKSSMKR